MAKKFKPALIQDAPAAKTTGRRVWVFRVLLLAAPFILLLIVELTLRLAGFGYPTSAILCEDVHGQKICHDNPAFGNLFFPADVARYCPPFSFPATKRPNTCRIFVLGESAAEGYPDAGISFGRILEVMLRQRYPGTEFEVVTIAMSAIDSHAFPLMANDCALYSPDLFVVYSGNNEVVGPFGPGGLFGLSTKNIHAIRAFISLKRLRVVQALTDARDRLAAKRSGTSGWRGMTMFTNHTVRATDPRLSIVCDHYKDNLDSVCAIAHRSGAKVILSTAACNLTDCPPFASLHGNTVDEQKWLALYQTGIDYEHEGQPEKATAVFLEAEKLDPEYADLQFRLADSYLAQSLFESAHERYVKARDLDGLRFRADTQINDVVKFVAARHASSDVHFLDAVPVFAKYAPNDLPGAELFLDHVHMTFLGRYVLAHAVLDSAKDLLPTWVTKREVQAPLPSEEECAAILGFTGWEERSMLKSLLDGVLTVPPFTAQIDHTNRIQEFAGYLENPQLQPTPENINLWSAQYRSAISRAPADWWLQWKYANFILNVLKIPALAGEHFQQVAAQMPDFSSVHAALGVIAGMSGDVDKALSECRMGVQLCHQDYMAHYYLGLMYERKAQSVSPSDAGHWRDLAASEYKETLVLSPLFIDARNTLAFLLWSEGDSRGTLSLLREGLRYTPDVADLHYRLGDLLAKLGQREEAAAELKAALKLDPNLAEASAELKNLE